MWEYLKVVLTLSEAIAYKYREFFFHFFKRQTCNKGKKHQNYWSITQKLQKATQFMHRRIQTLLNEWQRKKTTLILHSPNVTPPTKKKIIKIKKCHDFFFKFRQLVQIENYIQRRKHFLKKCHISKLQPLINFCFRKREI